MKVEEIFLKVVILCVKYIIKYITYNILKQYSWTKRIFLVYNT